jgi:hypothetical protein
MLKHLPNAHTPIFSPYDQSRTFADADPIPAQVSQLSGESLFKHTSRNADFTQRVLELLRK